MNATISGLRPALLACCALLAGPAAAELSAEAQRGKQVYTEGVSPAGRPMFARIGSGDLRLPASTAPCGSCHGEDGRGRPEGGVVPSVITWDALSKPYGGVSASGRRYPPYDEASLARLLAQGLDPAGNRLETLMPRYEIAAEDLADLVAYLKVIDQDLDPGVAQDSVRLGTILPLSGEGEAFGSTLRQVLEAYLADLNAAGGVFNRRLELKVEDGGASRASLEAAFDRLLGAPEPFAVLGAYAPGRESALEALVERARIPYLGAFGRGDGVDDDYRYGFFLFGDMQLQARALTHFARLRDSRSRPAVIYAESGRYPEVGQAMLAQARSYGWEAGAQAYAVGRMDAAAMATELAAAGVDSLMFAGPSGDLQELLLAASARGWLPAVFALGTLSANGIFSTPLGFQNRVFLAFPTAPADHTSAGMAEFRAFHARHRLPGRLVSAQIAAYAAAKTLVEGLKRTGRDLSRRKLIASLEEMYEFKTGLTPKLSFHPNRHIGAAGAHIVSVDLGRRQYGSKTTWIEPQ